MTSNCSIKQGDRFKCLHYLMQSAISNIQDSLAYQDTQFSGGALSARLVHTKPWLWSIRDVYAPMLVLRGDLGTEYTKLRAIKA